MVIWIAFNKEHMLPLLFTSADAAKRHVESVANDMFGQTKKTWYESEGDWSAFGYGVWRVQKAQLKVDNDE